MSTPSAPLELPLYGASFGQAVSRFFKKYATFTGRASRSEFWWAFLFLFIVGTVVGILVNVLAFAGASIDPTTGTTVPGGGFAFGIIIGIVFWLAVIIPYLAITWRRFHDTNKSGAFWFLSFIPFVGSIIVLILLLLDTDPAGARFDQP